MLLHQKSLWHKAVATGSVVCATWHGNCLTLYEHDAPALPLSRSPLGLPGLEEPSMEPAGPRDDSPSASEELEEGGGREGPADADRAFSGGP